MTGESNRFATLIKRVAKDDEQAATELFDQCHKAVLFFIHKRVKACPQLYTLFEPIDFLQEAWHEVFAHPESLPEFVTLKAFLKYLAGIARHKVLKARRKYVAQKRDQRRVRHLGARDIAVAAAVVADPRPGPARQAASHEAWLRWLASLPQRHQKVALRLRDGLTYKEIAAELGCSERSILRMVASIRGMAPLSL